MKRTHYEQQKHKILMYTRLAHIHFTPISHLTPVQKTRWHSQITSTTWWNTGNRSIWLSVPSREREPLEWNQWKVRELLKRKYGTEPWFTESLSAAVGTSEAVLYLPPSRGVHFPAFVKITGIYWQLWNGNRTACYSS